MNHGQQHAFAFRLQFERHVAAVVPGDGKLAHRIEFSDPALHAVLFGEIGGRGLGGSLSSSLRQTNSTGAPTFISIAPAASHLRRSSLSVRYAQMRSIGRARAAGFSAWSVRSARRRHRVLLSYPSFYSFTALFFLAAAFVFGAQQGFQ